MVKLAKNIKKQVKKNKEVSYLKKDFQSFRNELLNFANLHYGEKIIDFSDSSLGGLLLDLASYVGDSMSFYLDHQFNEVFLDTAIERQNVERLIRNSGVPIRGAAAAVVEVTVTIKVPSTTDSLGQVVPNIAYAPIVKSGSIFSSNSAIEFTLLEDLNFRLRDANGNIAADFKIAETDATDNISSFFMTLTGTCTSSKTFSENFAIDDRIVPFRTITLSKSDVTEIISVYDSNNDEYYEVESLTQDTVFKRFENSRDDYELVPERLVLTPAPKRFVAVSSLNSGRTLLRFGSGDENVFDEDIVPDPSLHAVTLYGDRKTFNKATIDPNSFLTVGTLGISPRNTTLTVTYRHGGGLNHNVSSGQISSVKTLDTRFNTGTPSNIATNIRASLSVTNKSPASGGENEPTLEELRVSAILGKNSQSRVVTREDLMARVYGMPSNLGRVFRASVRDNPNNPLAAQLHIISRNTQRELVLSSDTLKENLAIYLSKFRLISDAIDVLDAAIINLSLDYSVSIERSFNPEIVIQSINATLSNYFNIENFQIDQPIVIGEIENLILNTRGILSITNLTFESRSGIFENRIYSSDSFSVSRYLDRGLLFPPRGGIFEVKYVNDDIVGRIS